VVSITPVWIATRLDVFDLMCLTTIYNVFLDCLMLSCSLIDKSHINLHQISMATENTILISAKLKPEGCACRLLEVGKARWEQQVELALESTPTGLWLSTLGLEL
jgi:hypothetical protein